MSARTTASAARREVVRPSLRPEMEGGVVIIRLRQRNEALVLDELLALGREYELLYTMQYR